VLPRVSAALAQFISPIASSGKQSVSSQPGFERFHKDRPPSEGHPQPQPQLAKIIPFDRGEAAKAAPGANVPAGISQALLQLIQLFQEPGSTLKRWIGAGAYQRAIRQQKKTGRIRKGAILDEKAE
jgi:hypothetical protein